MTAAIHTLPHLDTPTLVCPRCHRRTVVHNVSAFVTPLGLRRYRRCGGCGEAFSTLEIPVGAHQVASLEVPAGTPRWLLRVLEWAARVGARGTLLN